MFAPKSAQAATRIKLGVAIIILDGQGHLLLEKRSDCGLWGLPGGRIEPGEAVQETAIREIKEETGLLIEIARLIGIYSDPAEGRIITYPDAVVHSVDIAIEAVIVGGALCRSDESEVIKFFDPVMLPSEVVPSSRAVLKDVIGGTLGQIR